MQFTYIFKYCTHYFSKQLQALSLVFKHGSQIYGLILSSQKYRSGACPDLCKWEVNLAATEDIVVLKQSAVLVISSLKQALLDFFVNFKSTVSMEHILHVEKSIQATYRVSYFYTDNGLEFCRRHCIFLCMIVSTNCNHAHLNLFPLRTFFAQAPLRQTVYVCKNNTPVSCTLALFPFTLEGFQE